MFSFKNIAVLFGFLSVAALSFAQPGAEVDVENTFEAQLINADKINTTPTLPPVNDKSTSLTYLLPSRLLNLEYDPPVIRPVAMKRDKLPEIYKFYAKLGIGFPLSPYAEASYYSPRSKKYNYGVNFLHHSMNNNSGYKDQRFAETALSGNADYYLKNGIGVGVHGGMNLDKYRFYGYDHADTTLFVADSVKQRFLGFDGGVKIFNSARTTSDLNYEVGLDMYQLSDRFSADELGINVHANIRKWIKEEHQVNVGIKNEYTYFNDSVTVNNNITTVSPNFVYHGNSFKVKAGTNLVYDSGSFYPFPDIEAEVNILSGKLVLQVGWTGEVERGTFKKLSTFNPFIVSDLELRNMRKQNRYAGVRGDIDKISYEARFAWKPVKNQAFFLNDTKFTERFAVTYDDINIYNIHAGASFQPVKGLDVLLAGDYNIYQLDTLTKAWHMPAFEGNLSMKYTTGEDDALIIKAEGFLATPAPFMTTAGEGTLNTLYDVSLGASYRFHKNVSVFGELNNLLNSKYQRWNQYPTVGFNVMGGVIIRY